jgi:hypothetical protein
MIVSFHVKAELFRIIKLYRKWSLPIQILDCALKTFGIKGQAYKDLSKKSILKKQFKGIG